MFWITLTLTLDQITKHLASQYLQGNFIKLFDFLYLTYATNRGISFGLFPDVKEIVIYLSLAITIVVSLIPYFKKVSKTMEFALALIVGGALGNLVDRIRFGYVIDFLTFKRWPTVFNLADIFITLGSVILLTILFRREMNEYRSHKSGRRMETGQISTRKDTGMGLKNVYPEGYQRGTSNSQWNYEEAELQGEVWGYNYVGRSGETTDSRSRT